MKKEKQFPSPTKIRSVSKKALPILDSLVLLRYRHNVDVGLRRLMGKTEMEKAPERDKEYEQLSNELYDQLHQVIGNWGDSLFFELS